MAHARNQAPVQQLNPNRLRCPADTGKPIQVSRCIPSGVASPANSASVHPFLRSTPDTSPSR